MLPLFLRLGVIHSRAVIFHLRDRSLPYLICSLPLLFVSPYMVPVFPRIGVIHVNAAIFHLRERQFPFLIYLPSSSFCFPLYGSSLPSVRGYTRGRCYFSSARAPPSISHIITFPFFLFPKIWLHFSLGSGLYVRALLFFICATAPFHFSYMSLILIIFFAPTYAQSPLG